MAPVFWSRCSGHPAGRLPRHEECTIRYLDPTAATNERVHDLISRMSLREKIGQLQQRLHGWKAYEHGSDGVLELTPTLRDEVERWGGLGSLYGLFRADPWSGVDWSNGILPERRATAARAVQDLVLDTSRHGIPALITEEAPHGHQSLGATVLPTNLSVGATWNPELLREASAEVARWLRRGGAHLALCSGLDIARDPRWGRSEECYSEDPHLAAALTRANVLGLQGEDRTRIDHHHVGVVLKHFAGQGSSMGGRNTAGAAIGTTELREIHLPAARAGVEAGALGLMASYNDVDGVPSIANHNLLTTILRGEWGFEGFVMADGAGVDRLAHTGASPVLSAALAVTAGVDMSLWDDSFTHLEDALAKGWITESQIDRACARVLATKFTLGLFEDPVPAVGELSAGSLAGRSLSTISEEMAQECLVLLSADGCLPVSGAASRIAVIGPNADSFDALLGDYVAPQPLGSGATIFSAIAGKAAAGVEVRTAPGSGLRMRDPERLAAARELARWADVVVLAVGGSSRRLYESAFAANGAAESGAVDLEMTAGEGVDLADVTLDAAQVELAREVRAVASKVISVVIAGRAHGIEDLLRLSNAVLYAWYPGPSGGNAIADVLFGHATPSGALPVSLPRTSASLPVAYNERLEPAGEYADLDSGPLFPLGFSALPSSLTVSRPNLRSPEVTWSSCAVAHVEITITNTGRDPGATVASLFMFRPVPGVWPRRKELVAFERARLDAGETRVIEFTIDLGWAASHFDRFDAPLDVTFSGAGDGDCVLRMYPPG